MAAKMARKIGGKISFIQVLLNNKSVFQHGSADKYSIRQRNAEGKQTKGGETMEYPRAMMKLSQMRDELGIPEGTLREAYYTPGQTFARKMNPLKKNSPIIFDTKAFENWWTNRAKAAQAGRR